MNNLKIGQLITEPQTKDAIHMAIAPVTVAHMTLPGRHVGLDKDGKASEYVDPYIGIIDPFLSCSLEAGKQCWLFLYPGSITGLRHEWSHPAFSATDVNPIVDYSKISDTDHKAKSQEWVKEHAAEIGMTPDQMMQNAEGWIEYDEHTVQHGREDWRDGFKATEFWHHYEIVTGKVVPEEKKRSFYCCTC